MPIQMYSRFITFVVRPADCERKHFEPETYFEPENLSDAQNDQQSTEIPHCETKIPVLTGKVFAEPNSFSE